VRFLAELGKPGPFMVTHVPRARRWQVLGIVPESLLALDDRTLGSTFAADARLPWTTAYSNVSGRLPLADVAPGNAPVIVQTHLEVLAPGHVTLEIGDASGMKLWVDGKVAALQERLRLDLPRGVHTLLRLELPRGVHTLTFFVARQGQDKLEVRCALVDTPGSTAQARFLVGK